MPLFTGPVQLSLEHAEMAARVHRVSFDARLPWLAGLHTPQEDASFFREHVFRDCSVWGMFAGDELAGMIAFQEGWIDQLYVLPAYQGAGIGRKLLGVARSRFDDLQLWTFQKNAEARRFYERHGFSAVEFTDGSGNAEGEPDVRYRWTAHG